MGTNAKRLKACKKIPYWNVTQLSAECSLAGDFKKHNFGGVYKKWSLNIQGKKSEKSLRRMRHFLLLTYFLPTYLLRIYLLTYYLLPT